MAPSNIRASLVSHGYVVLGESDLGLTCEDRSGILGQFFRDDVLGPGTPRVTPIEPLEASAAPQPARSPQLNHSAPLSGMLSRTSV